ncbi:MULTISPECIES: fumarate/nitrate reduction transcriptional regulator Fnr [Oceanospirillaceae]|jgi:CRP/FNR family transcriptional regulator, anaerobic regulatory protein|uniref:fumarate/nitrate reduction transcriptional regulator Fnr n=1 Tax=Oceanospirillaceae TaxID=135620 RepID=UPI000C695B9A|nr:MULTISPECIES: fumarate/nitrate reduction transcriptional regulator Fnr [Thalassolituus]MBU2039851.1 fumarate/nitrate reduction transcriptional regulator Fnr [Gammaproteobacteria bacterium]PIQ39723.1 MAG: transcriptional regulator FNR [Thalassolituus sp. CG17_big_fil_post_rev_8_21_14_2_50_53_8]MCA6060772.1 fumarate/nitrate reduction transcriptional regulator Fnr [Thalassolituus sp. ST750PaO-4]MCB2385846.1 fumarate/nitrate reduction transcriptional regulator Fnr [Thalassolituus alkanivorans]M
MKTTHVAPAPLRGTQPHCQTCSLNALCLPLSLNDSDMERLDDIIRRGRPIQKGQLLFQQGEAFQSVFAVRTGALKTYTLASNGEEQITGFHLASELVGLAGYDNGNYPLTAKALETTTVCEIPLQQLDSLADDLPDLRKQLMRTMGTEIRHDQNMMLLLSKKNAEERVASFLIDISQRYSRRGFSASHFRLPMSRVDISNYLGLAVETISRVFTRFQKNGLIETQGKEVILQDPDMLYELAGLNTEKECAAHPQE